MKNVHVIVIAIGALLIGLFIGRGNMHTEMNEMNHAIPANDMEHMMMSMTRDLEGKTGEVFDKAFLEGMIVHHQGAVEMAEMVLETSQRPELISLAQAIIEAQTVEINQMQSWKEQWFK